MSGKQFFRGIADMHRIVHHQGRWMHMLQYMGGGDIGHVEGRILAHQHDIDLGEIDGFGGTGREMVAFLPPEGDGPRPGRHLAVAQREITRMIMIELVAPPLGRQAHDKAGITIDIDAL